MKKIALVMMMAALAVGVAGCQGPKGPEQGDQTTAMGTTAPPTQMESQKEPTSGSQEDDEVPGGNLQKIHTAVKEAYGDSYIPSMAYDAQGFEEIFGIGPDLYESYLAEGPMISAHVETFVAVRAKEGKGKEVEALLLEYRDRLLEDGMQYPMNLPKIQASEVVRHGDDVYFVMLGGADMEAEEQGEEAALKSAKENNQIGLDVIEGFY